MKRYLYLTFFIFLSYSSKAYSNLTDSLFYTQPDQFPEFPGGEVAFNNYLAKSVKYPTLVSLKGYSGTIIVQLLIDEKGNLEGIQIIKKIGGGCDEKAMMALKAMPQWKPGYKNNIPVKTKITKTVVFSNDTYTEKDIDTSFNYYLTSIPAKINGQLCDKFIDANLKYPDLEKQYGINRDVFVEYTIDRTGHLENLVVKHENNSAFKKEVYRVFSIMPQWKPAQINYVSVRSTVKCIVSFRLRDENNNILKPHFYDYGVKLFEQNKIKDAFYAFKDAINENSKNSNAYFNAAICASKLGKEAEAHFLYRKSGLKDSLLENHFAKLSNLNYESKSATFPGGQEGFSAYMNANSNGKLVSRSLNTGFFNSVLVWLTINKYGYVEDITTGKIDPTNFDLEAMRLTRNMPRWNPAIYNGEEIEDYFVLPFTFTFR